MNRREFLQLATAGAVGLSVTGKGKLAAAVNALAAPNPLTLTMRPCLLELVDGNRVFVWGYETPVAGLRVPGPTIFADEGTIVDLVVVNGGEENHAFSIPGVVFSGIIPPGQSVRVRFPAPAAGNYLYSDPLNAPVNRVMGLGGQLIIMPPFGNTPYSAPTPAVQSLFDDLGTTEMFPGEPWTPFRMWAWNFQSIDPVKHQMVRDLPPGRDIDPAAFMEGYFPRYFLINGRSGFFSSQDPLTSPHGTVGQPGVIRCASIALTTHSPHIHGNHVYVLAGDGVVQENVLLVDTWTMTPAYTADVLLPYIAPSDAYPWPPSNSEEFTGDIGESGSHGMVFPMHCHTEMSQTADGAAYPQGMVCHWAIEGPLGGLGTYAAKSESEESS